MSGFEKELDGILEIIKDEKFYNSKIYALPSIEELKAHFKDWQPPEKLVEVPQFLADWFENQLKNNELKKFDGNDVFRIIQDVIKVSNDESTWEDYGITDEIVKFAEDNEELFLNLIVNCSVVNGYTVKKEQLFCLKNKNTGHFLYRQPKESGGNLIEVVATINEEHTWFTQDEIDTMHTDSYEKIKVEP